MPFTPFHLGPGALFKGIGGERFSFLIFGGSQVLMDVEPLVRMIRGDTVLHGPSHTILGALTVALVATAAGRSISNLVLSQTGIGDRLITWRIALVSALIGTFSHVGLDAIMHRDMHPLWPFAEGNALLGVISVKALHMMCIGAGVVGGGLLALRSSRPVDD